MAVKTDTRQIGEHKYRVTQLPGLKARELFTRIVRLIGPAAAAAVGSGRGLSRFDLGELFGSLTSRITDDELGHFCTVLGECTELLGSNGAATKLDTTLQDVHFAGELLNMFKWLQFALEVNFADFLSVWRRTQAAESTAQTSAASRSPQASTGTSIAS